MTQSAKAVTLPRNQCPNCAFLSWNGSASCFPRRAPVMQPNHDCLGIRKPRCPLAGASFTRFVMTFGESASAAPIIIGASGNQPSVSAVTFCAPNRARKRSQGFCPRQDLHQQSYNRDLWWVSLLLPLCLAAAVFLIIMIFGV